MTYLDVVFPYGTNPGESELRAIDGMREVYGVRKIELNEAAKTVRIEYDATRLTEPVIHQLLRRAGLDIVETVSMFPIPEDIAPPPPVQTSVAS